MKQMITVSAEKLSELNNIIESYRVTGWRLVTKGGRSAVLENDGSMYFKPSEYQTDTSAGNVKC